MTSSPKGATGKHHSSKVSIWRSYLSRHGIRESKVSSSQSTTREWVKMNKIPTLCHCIISRWSYPMWSHYWPHSESAILIAMNGPNSGNESPISWGSKESQIRRSSSTNLQLWNMNSNWRKKGKRGLGTNFKTRPRCLSESVSYWRRKAMVRS